MLVLTQVEQFGLKDPSLIKTKGLIDGVWVDAKNGATISVTSAYTLEDPLENWKLTC